MSVRLDIDGIKQDFKFADQESTGKCRLKHNTGNKAKLLPYKTNEKPNADDLAQFSGILGEFSRLLLDKKMKEDFNVKDIVDDITMKVHFENEKDKSWFIDIVKELFLNHSGVEIFHPLLLNYLPLKSSKQRNIARFLNDVLVDYETKIKLKDIYNSKADNVLLRLMLKSLPVLDPADRTDEPYLPVLPFISDIFNEDLLFMISNTSFFVKDIDKLLEYYYFFYVSQLTLKFDKMFEAEIPEPIPIYFNLDWEKTTKIRTSYIKGWAYLSPKIPSLFPHAITLELLNHSDGHDQLLTYTELYYVVQAMDHSERKYFQQDIELLLNLYKEHVEDVDWKGFSVTEKYEDVPLLNHMYKLQRAIEFQFTNKTSGRKAAYQKYAKWFEDYAKAYFCKKRGPLGYTLNITQDFLIFFIRLSIRDRSKIKLKQLFEEFEKRGIFFDRDSKDHIIRLLEKLNLLEKKSDSGDAQYVKSVL